MCVLVLVLVLVRRYGDQRLTLGVSTTWTISILNLFQDQGGGAYANDTAAAESLIPLSDGQTARSTSEPGVVQILDSLGNVTSVDSIDVPPRARFQPVRLIRIQLHISRFYFTAPSDVLFVYEGGASLSGARVSNLVGTDSFADPPPYPPASGTPASALSVTQTRAYQDRYGAQLAAVQNRSLVEVVVLTNSASLHFTSRATANTHFFATYTYEFACLPVSDFFLDPDTNKCRAQLPKYNTASGIRHAVFAVASCALVWIGVNAAAIVLRWEAPLYRAASRQFLLLLLAMLAMMSFGSMLYAALPPVRLSERDGATPESDSDGRAICIGRVWLSCMPLAGILGVILAKTNRIDNIFGSMTLLKAKSVSDGAIFKSVGALLLVECGFMLVFSTLPLSSPNLAPGTGSLANQLVISCSMESGAYVWLGIQVAFFALLMVGAAWMAFRTRNLPSAFNESQHISSCVVVLMFFGVLIVPLTLYVHQQPESAVLLQGLGQALLVLLLTSILFGPKLYVTSTTSFAQQKAMMSNERAAANMTIAGGGTGSSSAAVSRMPGSGSSGPNVVGGATGRPARSATSANRPSASGRAAMGMGMTGPSGGAAGPGPASPFPRTNNPPPRQQTVSSPGQRASFSMTNINPHAAPATASVAAAAPNHSSSSGGAELALASPSAAAARHPVVDHGDAYVLMESSSSSSHTPVAASDNNNNSSSSLAASSSFTLSPAPAPTRMSIVEEAATPAGSCDPDGELERDNPLRRALAEHRDSDPPPPPPATDRHASGANNNNGAAARSYGDDDDRNLRIDGHM